MKTFSIHLSLLASLLLLAACSENTELVQDNDLVQYNDLEISLRDSEGLSDRTAALVESINNDEQVSFKEITDQLIEVHAKAYQKINDKTANETTKKESIASFLDQITEDIKTTDLHERKTSYEEKANRVVGEPILYNRAAVSIANIPLDGRLQCFSGTSLNQVINRGLSEAKGFQSENHVVIFTSGHVLSGYMTKDEEGDWNLNGIETTATGRAQVIYGKTKQLSTPMRVIDAERWAILELVKFNLENSAELLDSVVRYTAEKYDIDLGATAIPSPSSGLGVGNGENQETQSLLNSSLFGFGQADVPDGDIERSEFDSQDYSPSQNLSSAFLDRHAHPQERNTLYLDVVIQSEESLLTTKIGSLKLLYAPITRTSENTFTTEVLEIYLHDIVESQEIEIDYYYFMIDIRSLLLRYIERKKLYGENIQEMRSSQDPYDGDQYELNLTGEIAEGQPALKLISEDGTGLSREGYTFSFLKSD